MFLIQHTFFLPFVIRTYELKKVS
jgi:hypothetical protein